MYTIYSKPNCQNCETAKRIFHTAGIEYKVKVLDIDYQREYLIQKGVRELPYIVDDERVIGGLKDLLKENLT
jgi:glutaredoxin